MYAYLSELKAEDKGRVKTILGEGSLRQKLLDMGIVSGTLFEVIKQAPLGDPIEIKIRGYNLSLRKEEAGNVLVEVV